MTEDVLNLFDSHPPPMIHHTKQL